MRLAGKYIYDKLIETFQGNFGMVISQRNDIVTIDLWQLQVRIFKQTCVEFYIRKGEDYISFGKIELH